ncbi:MAG: hypothetical protein MUE91_07290 [Ignavibacteriaceae bacterium]|jgi:hypothetical protein|nr:hypothetical protein [Ignavibacteriaceae bacterium]
MEVKTFRIAIYTDYMKNQHKVKFHQWGLEIIEDNNGGISNYTTGIIEHEDGQIECVHPSCLKFEGKVTQSI